MLPFEPDPVWPVATALLSLVGCALLFKGREQTIGAFLAFLSCAAFMLFFAGFSAGALRTHSLATPMLGTAHGPAMVEGRIVAVESLPQGRGLRLVMDDLSVARLAPENTPKRVRVTVRQKDTPAYQAGMRVRALARLNPPSPPVIPGGFDFQRHAFFQRLGAFGFSYEAPQIIAPREKVSPGAALTEWFEPVREHIRGQSARFLPPHLAAFATALMTGERSAISGDDWDAMRGSGLAHMLAISGLHVGLVAGIVLFVVRFGMACVPALALRRPVKKYAALAALLAAIFYTILVGATVPTVRAMLMTGAVLVAIMLDRMAISLRMVALAAFCLLLLIPEALWSASFQMSFAAVAALVYGYEVIRPRWSSWHRGARWPKRILLYFGGVSITTIIASLATAPFALYHFQHLALYSLLANLAAVPLLGFVVMPAAVLAYVLMPLGLAAPALMLMGWGIDQILMIAHAVADMPYASWHPRAMGSGAFLSLIAAALWLILWQGKGKWLALPLLMAAVFFGYAQTPPTLFVSGNARLAALQTEQGAVAFSSRQAERFSADNWRRYWGIPAADRVPLFQESPSFACDGFACRTAQKGYRISFLTHPSAAEEECAWADLLVSTRPVRRGRCRQAQSVVIIDRFDVWREGTHAVWLEPQNIRVETVYSRRGNRPWSVSNRR